MAVKFTDDFEEGDLTDFNSTVDGGDLAANGTAAMVGSYGMEVTLTGTTSSYGINAVTITSNDIRYRLYWDPTNASFADGDTGGMCDVRCDGTWAGETEHTRLDWKFSTANNLEIRAAFQDDESVANYTSWTSVSDAEHYIEILCSRESSDGANDGVGRVYLDGVETGGSQTGIGNFGMFQTIDELRTGITFGQTATVTGSWYMDDIIFRDDATEIGPAGGSDLSINVTPDDIDYYTQGIRVK
jgi:hypothetical protein